MSKEYIPSRNKSLQFVSSATKQEKQFPYKFMNKGITLCVIPIFSVTVAFFL